MAAVGFKQFGQPEVLSSAAVSAAPPGVSPANGSSVTDPAVTPVVSPIDTNAGGTPGETGEDACPTTESDSTLQHSDTPTLRPSDSDEQTFNRLAALSPAQYDRTRKAEATHLGIRLETLDTEVAKSRTELDYDDQARAAKLPPVEPWPEPVDGAEVLDQVSERFTLHVFLPPGAADGITLWDAHAHAFQAFLHSPHLNLTSPEKGCGKTTTLDLLATMTLRALRTENLTAPVLFRVVDQHQPTLLLDEVDAYLTHSEELRVS